MKKLLSSLLLLCLPIFADNLWAQTDYQMAGPYEVVARDGQYRYSKGSSDQLVAQPHDRR